MPKILYLEIGIPINISSSSSGVPILSGYSDDEYAAIAAVQTSVASADPFRALLSAMRKMNLVRIASLSDNPVLSVCFNICV